MHLLALCLSVYENVDPLLIFFLLDLNMLTVPMAECNSIAAEIERPFLLKTFSVYLSQYLLRNLI